MSTVTTTRNVGLGKLLRSVGNAYRSARYFVKSTPMRFPRLVQCNVCGWRGKHLMSDAWHQHSNCPMCRSGVRHRLLMAALAHLPALSIARLAANKRVLHFAPERYIERVFRKQSRVYITADYNNPRRDLRLDISNMLAIESGSLDLVMACDVLEHVEDDGAALSEMFRVLDRGGYAVVTVPQQDGLAETFEDLTIVDPKERKRVFGQSDHLRIYGDDFAQQLETAGFQVSVVCETDFAPSLVEQHVLFPPELSTNPLATNYRKVFFARKP